MEGCGNKFMKYFIIGLNAIFLIVGLALAGIAGYAAFDTKSMIHQFIVGFHISNIVTGLYIMMAVGIFLALVSFLGCIGSATENRCMLGTYFGIILVIFIVQLAAVILCFVKYKDVKKQMKLAMAPHATSAHYQRLRGALNIVQTQFHCCGLDTPNDWTHRGSKFPATCYDQPNVNTIIKLFGDEKNANGNTADVKLDDTGAGGSDGSQSVGQKAAGTGAAGGATSATQKPVGGAGSAGGATSATQKPAGGAGAAGGAGSAAAATTATSATQKPAGGASVASTKIETKPTTKKPIVVAQTTKPVQGTTKSTLVANTTIYQHSSGSHLYMTGCMNKLKPAFYAVGGIGIFVLFLEILVMVFACMLYSAIKHGYNSIA